MSAPALLDVRDLSRDYKSGGLFEARRVTRALDEVSIRIEAGSIFGIVGESGCGKSTLARIVAALDRPTSGKVLFEGQDLHALPAEKLKRARRDFQMIFQDPFGSFDPRHMVGRIVAEPLHVLESRPGKPEARERVISMLDAVGLPTEAARLFPHEFSGGQRQRIAIARALITEPKLVIADEPVSALDLSVQAQVLNLILDLREKKGVAFLFISHSLSVIDCIAEFVGVMYQGRLVETGPTRTIFDEPLHPYTRLLRDSSPSIHKLGNATGARPAKTPRSASTPSTGCAYRSRCPVALERCVIERPELRAIETGRTVACHAI